MGRQHPVDNRMEIHGSPRLLIDHPEYNITK